MNNRYIPINWIAYSKFGIIFKNHKNIICDTNFFLIIIIEYTYNGIHLVYDLYQNFHFSVGW